MWRARIGVRTLAAYPFIGDADAGTDVVVRPAATFAIYATPLVGADSAAGTAVMGVSLQVYAANPGTAALCVIAAALAAAVAAKRVRRAAGSISFRIPATAGVILGTAGKRVLTALLVFETAGGDLRQVERIALALDHAEAVFEAAAFALGHAFADFGANELLVADGRATLVRLARLAAAVVVPLAFFLPFPVPFAPLLPHRTLAGGAERETRHQRAGNLQEPAACTFFSERAMQPVKSMFVRHERSFLAVARARSKQ